MSHEDWKRINEANSQLAETNIQIVDDAGITAAEIKYASSSTVMKSYMFLPVVIGKVFLPSSTALSNLQKIQNIKHLSFLLFHCHYLKKNVSER